VGDAVKRIITLTAADVSGMAFAPMQHPVIEGLGIYPGEPTVEDASARGSLAGQRIETVTYIFERPGDIEIPSVTLAWWDVEAEELKRIELSGLTLRISGDSATQQAGTAEAPHPRNSLVLWLTVIAIAVVTAMIALIYRDSIATCWTAWRKARSETEAAYFRRVMKSVRSEDPKATVREIMRWLDRIKVDQQPARLDQFLRQYGDASVRQAAVNLVASLSPEGKNCSFSTLGRGLAAARSRWRQRQLPRKHANSRLPELNGSPAPMN
jgi:hypothetical protein